MKYGVREICEVTMRAKARMQVGNKVFYKDEPVIYFDTLTTSSLEGSSTTVYAQGGRGNVRLMSWDGERTLTFTMEDALISPEGLMILTGAGIIESDLRDEGKMIKQHMVETISREDLEEDENSYHDNGSITFTLSAVPYMPNNHENNVYVMFMKNGEIISEPFIPANDDVIDSTGTKDNTNHTLESGNKTVKLSSHYCNFDGLNSLAGRGDAHFYESDTPRSFWDFDAIMVDYYTCRRRAKQVEIEPDTFGGNFYLEASTLFRGTDGVDYPAEFIIPNCRIQSNFTFSMSSTGDPSTFTFTLDAFPDYTRWDKSKKVLAAIQVIEDVNAGAGDGNYHRGSTGFDQDILGAAGTSIHEDHIKFENVPGFADVDYNKDDITWRGRD